MKIKSWLQRTEKNFPVLNEHMMKWHKTFNADRPKITYMRVNQSLFYRNCDDLWTSHYHLGGWCGISNRSAKLSVVFGCRWSVRHCYKRNWRKGKRNIMWIAKFYIPSWESCYIVVVSITPDWDGTNKKGIEEARKADQWYEISFIWGNDWPDIPQQKLMWTRWTEQRK